MAGGATAHGMRSETVFFLSGADIPQLKLFRICWESDTEATVTQSLVCSTMMLGKAFPESEKQSSDNTWARN